MKIFRKILASYYLVRGKDALSRHNDLDALSFLHKASLHEKEYDICIYKGLSEFLLKKFDNALISYQSALNLVEKTTKLNKDEKEYLKKYILNNLLIILEILEKYENKEKYLKIFKNIDYDIVHIRQKILEGFPLS